MTTLTLTKEQAEYLYRAVVRDKEFLEEMPPWEIDDGEEEHEREMELQRELHSLLVAKEVVQ